MRLLLILISFTFSSLLHADIYVVVSPNSHIESISKSELAALYLGRQRPDQHDIRLYPLDREGELRSLFFESITNMSLSQVNAYWAKLRFSGRVRPLDSFNDPDSLQKKLLANPASISYLDSKPESEQLKVVMVIHE
ncbi:hypothetical protein KP803_15925 [Vibrio sp. ZSDE26]|uniref:Phosphate ABC transporter substrate-binding protein n=1 Tax=Vibrio amylolyticus TaxID=2847292 RepID=A0A9X1XL72_9VIBR|nr:hypothetical protein [Vibrio amylolyticus]MCK6264766.1 hypothetical protein [Vibrio amylolyticus]